MIKLNKDYSIGFDPMNIVLYKAGITSKKSKTPGEEKFSPIGYFGDFKHLADSLLKVELCKEDKDTLNEILVKIEDFKKDILESISNVKEG